MKPYVARRALQRALCTQSTVSVDTSGLLGRRGRVRKPHEHVEYTTGLMHDLSTQIRFRGPLSVAEYMNAALTHPEYGYYMRRDIFGRAGDFITSPEVSQVFGELIGIWSVACWQQMGQPRALRLAEVGPGRGTLMADLLRATSAFPAFQAAVSVHLLEVSPRLRDKQRSTLSATGRQEARVSTSGGPEEAEVMRTKCESGDRAGAVHSGTTQSVVNSSEDSSQFGIRRLQWQAEEASQPVEVSWHGEISEIPRDAPLLLVGHEFLDALPVHQFCRTPRGWRERLVDLKAHQSDTNVRLAWQGGGEQLAGEKEDEAEYARSLDEDARDLDFVVAPAATPASALFTRELPPHMDQAEICPKARAFVQQVSQRVQADGGAALFIDYGSDRPPTDSLRGILGHRFVHPLHRPGEVDLSTDVDFAALRRVVFETAPELRTPQLAEQRHFLAAMGIEARVNALLAKCSSAEMRRALVDSASRLVASPGMGSAYCAFSLAHPCIGQQVPGFAPCP
eukprot:CAMPEP_0119306572 /NCGR_PEP_ID=MMETSP1333-20130426/7290_1 /TAXON_ID=418940 /ORGANISM="Scyphosphaera apsteinii, Strain RCC1455" /LENGTH=508 /DNA_ID=CAMNT_0007309901 /DNA_START=76 /DNA_END=1602 /DNA_ORIENTATION=+